MRSDLTQHPRSTVASKDGSKRIDPADSSAATRKAKTAAEQRQQVTGSNDPEVLAAEIERTREELAETLDAIADKVSPKRVTARTKKKVGDAVKDGAEQATATVKAGAAQLKEAVVERTETVRDKAGDVTAKVHGSDSTADVPSTTAALPVAGTDAARPVLDPLAAPGLRPVPPPAGSSLSLGQPAVIGAVVAALVALLVLRRRRR
jgi:gas vesicle protein